MQKKSKPGSRGNRPPFRKHPAKEASRSRTTPRLEFRGEQIFGAHAVREALLNPERTIYRIYAVDASARNIREIIESRPAGAAQDLQIIITDKDSLDKALAGAVHQGMAADAAPLPELDVHELLIRVSGKERAVFAMLDQITDPHNVGAILRSASAFGIDGLIMQRKNSPSVAGVLAKTACGAAEHVPVCYETNLSRTIEVLKDAGFEVYGLDEHAHLDIGEVNPSRKSLIILGAEGPGMRRLIREGCDHLVRLPTLGPIQSLNVSNAAAIAFFTFRRM